MQLSEFIQIDSRRARSVNLERDGNSTDIIKQYYLTGNGLRCLLRFVDALEGEPVNAWSLTGPYGMGKSAFANYMLALTAPQRDKLSILAREKLRNQDSDLADRYEKSLRTLKVSRPFLHIVATAAYEPVNKTVARGLLHGLQEFKPRRADKKNLARLIAKTTELTENRSPSTVDIVDALGSASQICKCPFFVIIDEFGKNLEFQSHNIKRGDLYILQILAEREDTFLWVCLHQAFRGYASALSDLQREEWQKIQGRFEDLPFVEPCIQMLFLIRETLQQVQTHGLKTKLDKWARHFRSAINSLCLADLNRLTVKEIRELYPINPIAAWLLTELCRRFAQNDRTLFSFLCSGAPLALPAYLESNELSSGKRLPTLSLDGLYDYFADISVSNGRPETQRWLEVRSRIQALQHLPAEQLKVVKTIGLLNVLSGDSGVSAKINMIRCAMGAGYECEADWVDTTIDALTANRLLLYRDYAREYRLWEGTDIDLAQEIQKARSQLGHRPLSGVLEEVLPLSPLIVARHSYETGTVRDFERRWALPEELSESFRPQDADGLILYIPGKLETPEYVPEVCLCGRPLVVAYNPCADQIQNLALELAAAVGVCKDLPALAHDGVARCEAHYRAQMARKALLDYLAKSFEPGTPGLCWFANGNSVTVGSRRKLSALLSKLCDNAYKNCPDINNEMINHDHLSSAAARARRELSEAMIAHEKEEGLALKGEGPEVAVYRTLFKATSLHVQEEDGSWRFVPPQQKNKKFREVWNAIDKAIPESAYESIAVTKLIHLLKEPQFGMREGPILLLLCHYLIVNADEIALYQEGTYAPYFGGAEIALMIKRPELFALRRYVQTGLRRDVVQAYMQVLETNVLQLDDRVRNPSLLRIVTPFLRFVESLPQYTRFTRRISLNAQKLRGAILNSREPIQLLFKDIPESLGIDPLQEDGHAAPQWKERLRDSLKEVLLELFGAYERLNLEVQRHIMDAFGWEQKLAAFPTFRSEMLNRISPLVKQCKDESLRPVLGAFVMDCTDDAEWTRGIAGQVIKKPVDSWRDTDLEPFRASIMEVADRIESLRKIVAAGIGLDDDGVVVTLTHSDGRKHRHIVRLDERTRCKLRDVFSEVFDKPQDMRAALCALLSESLEEDK